jgi:hypothetical protein
VFLSATPALERHFADRYEALYRFFVPNLAGHSFVWE